MYKEGIISFDGSDKENKCGSKQASGGCCGGKVTNSEDAQPDAKERAQRVAKLDLNEYVGSYKIFAVKPTD